MRLLGSFGIVLFCGFGLVYALRKRGLQPISSEDSLDQRKRRLLVEFARLDDDYEYGRIPEDEYHRLRTERKAQLVDIIRRSGE